MSLNDLRMSLPHQIEDHGRWSTLARFVEAWYRQPLRAENPSQIAALESLEQDRGAPLPDLLREWYLLVGDRLERPDPGHPILELWFPSLEAKEGKGSVGDIGVVAHVEREQPFLLLDSANRLQCLTSAPDDLARFLTSIVVWQTVHCAAVECYALEGSGERLGTIRGPLGTLARHARALTVEALSSTHWEGLRGAEELKDEAGVSYLKEPFESLDLGPLEYELSQIEFVGSPGFEIVIAIRSENGESSLAEAGTLGRAHKTKVQTVYKQRQKEFEVWERTERTRRAEAAKAANEELLGQVPSSDAEVLAALEALEPSLLRFERSFLEDFRRSHASGQIRDGQRLRAAKILTKPR